MSGRDIGRRMALMGCLAGACVGSLWALDAMAMSRLTGAQAAAVDPTPVLPADSDVPEELAGLYLDGSLYVPLRAALRLIGGEPLNGAEAGRVRTISGVGLVELEVGGTRCTVNGREGALREPVIVRAGTTYLAARDFAEMFGVPVTVVEDGREATFSAGGREVTARPESAFYEIEIERSARRLTLRFRGKEAQSFPVCVGKGRATPLGSYRVANKVVWPAWRSIYTGALVPGGRGNPLGARWLGLTARGSGGHAIGIHGTNAPSSIGRAASAGCIRMHNKDIITVHEKVMVGTPVHIRE
ncbi:MAG: L,D-transpeptidase family protein [Armatimonadota bacterium]